MSRHPLVRSPVYPDIWTAVYRLYDAADRLLYVGVGYDYLTRWKAHAKHKAWWPEVVRKDVIWFDNRLDAMYEEARAIRDEGPVHNDTRRGAGVGISPFGFSTFRVGAEAVPDPAMDFSRWPLQRPRFEEMISRHGAHTAVATEGDLVGVIVPIEWYRYASEQLGDPVEF